MSTFVEACAGTAAITFALFGEKPPVPMAGSKRTLAPYLIERFQIPKPDRVIWNDPGEWGQTLHTLFRKKGAWDDVAHLLAFTWGKEDEQVLFDRLRAAPAPTDPILRAATHLYLQTRTYRGKPVFPKPNGTGWVTHGFDPEVRMAVTPGAKSRGAFNARPDLAKKLRHLGTVAWPDIEVLQISATHLVLPDRAIVLLDPPYRNRPIGYADKFSRWAVVAMARELMSLGKGHRVLICEAEPIAELVAVGWKAEQIPTRRTGTQLSVTEEWVTYS